MAGVDLNNQTLQKIEGNKNSLMNEAQNNYNTMASGASQKYDEMVQASKDYAQTQSQITQQKTDQAIAEINQNKDKAEQDYIKEQKGAYNDYAQQTNAYGVNAETQASAGLTGSGYSESSKVSMYNTYQNRYATARESYNQAVLNYDNQITNAQIQNSALLAEIAYNALQTQLQTAIEGMQYQNELLNNLTNQKINISTSYDNLWQSQYSTLLNESQFNEQMAFQREQANIANSQWQQEFNLSRATASRSSSGGSSGSSGSASLTSGSNKLTSGSNIDDIYKSLLDRQPEGLTDNMGGRIKFNAWNANSIKYLEALYADKQITETEMAELVSRLGLEY